MKKAIKSIIALSLVGISLFSMVGCNGGITQKALSEMESRITALESALASEQATTSSLTEKAQEQDDTIEVLSSANSQLSDRVDELTETNTELSDQVDELTAANTELNGRVDELTAANGQLTEQNEALSDRVDELTEANEELTEQNEQLNDRIDELTKTNTESNNKPVEETPEQRAARLYQEALKAVAQADPNVKYITDEDAAKYGNDLSRYSQDEIHITLKPEYYGMEITKEVLGFENVKIIYDPTKNPNINVNSTKEYTIQIALEVDGTEMVQAAVIHCRSLEFVKDAWIPCFVLIPA